MSQMHLKTRHNFPGESTLDPAYFSRLQWLLANLYVSCMYYVYYATQSVYEELLVTTWSLNGN